MTAPHAIADQDTEPIEVPSLTAEFAAELVKREVSRHAGETQVSPRKLALAMREIERLEREKVDAERRAREASSPILTWARRNQKLLLWIILGGGGSTGALATVRGELQESAEAAVLERQAEEKQAEAVKENTEAIEVGSAATENVGVRVDALEVKVDANAELMRTAIEVQLAQPSVKKRIKSNPTLRKKAEAAVGSLD